MFILYKIISPELRNLPTKQAKLVKKTVALKYQYRLLIFVLLVYAFFVLLMTHQWFGPFLSIYNANLLFVTCSIAAGIISVAATFLFFRSILREEITKQIKYLGQMSQENKSTKTPYEHPNPHTA